MKYSVSNIILYLLGITKIVATVVILMCQTVELTPVSIIVIFTCFSAAYHKELAAFCSVALFIILMVWIIAVIISVLGLLFDKLRSASFFLLTITSIVDLISAICVSSINLKIRCILFSILTITVCIKNIVELKTRLTEHDYLGGDIR